MSFEFEREEENNKKENIAIIHSLSELILITFNQRMPPLFLLLLYRNCML